MIRPTRRTLLLALFGAPVAVLPAVVGAAAWPVWVAYVALAVFAIGLDVVLLPRAAAVALKVEPPGVLFLGDPDPLQLALDTQLGGRLPVDVAVDVGGELEPLPAATAVCARGAPAVLSLPLRVRRRGGSRIDRVWLRWPGPMGLVTRTAVHAVGRAIEVVPDVRSVKAQALRFFARSEFQVGLKVEQFVSDGSEFQALREFVPGFDRRSVDWKATARHQKLLCREYRAERNHQVVLAVDCGHLMSEPLLGMPRIDHAINAALMLAYVCLKTGDLVGTFAFDERPRGWLRPENGLRALPALQRSLSGCDYSAAETNYTLALTELLARCRRRTLVILFTDFVDSVTAELMVPNLDRLASRHLVLFVTLRDPLLRDLCAVSPRTPLDLHRAAVAADLQRDREVVLARIRRLGVHVLEAEAGQVGPQLINRYLDLKRRESL